MSYVFSPSCTVLDEIEDRRQFLKEMEALGNGREYYHIINTEISQVYIPSRKLNTSPVLDVFKLIKK